VEQKDSWCRPPGIALVVACGRWPVDSVEVSRAADYSPPPRPSLQA
jgi:hypothetical protein